MAAHAYIGSFTSAGGRGLTAAAVDQGTGGLTALGHTADVQNPSFLALSADGGTLYAVSETEPEGAAAAFSLADPAAPRLLGAPVPVRGGAPTHLALHQGHLLTANYSAPGSVTVLGVKDDGSLGAVRHVLEHEGSGPNRERQEGPHAHAVLPDPTGRWALSVDLGTDSVRVCELDRDSGELEIERELGLRSGIGPRHLTFHPAGGHAYVMNELDSVVTVCRWDPDKGSLRPLDEVRVLPEDSRQARTSPRNWSSRPVADSPGPPTAGTTASPCSAWTRPASGSNCSTPSAAAATGRATSPSTRRAAGSTRPTSAQVT